MTDTAAPGSTLEQAHPFPLSRRLADLGNREQRERVRDYALLIAGQMSRLEGQPAAPRRELPSPDEASWHVKELAREAGADLAGITHLRSHHLTLGSEVPDRFAVVLAMTMRPEEIRQAQGAAHLPRRASPFYHRRRAPDDGAS